MRVDSTALRIGRHFLLIALAIQGFTPDFRDLASRWLIKLLTCNSTAFTMDVGSSRHHGENHREGPDHVCSPASVDASLRTRLDNGSRPFAAFTPLKPYGGWVPLVHVFSRRLGIATRERHDMIRSLCRFVC